MSQDQLQQRPGMAAFLTKLGSKNNSLPVTFELPTNFVDWPKGEKGHLLQEVEVALPLQEALDALFGRRAAVGEVCRKKQGSHDYAETEWLPNEAEAREAFRHITAAHHQGEDAFAATAKRQLDRSSKALHEGRASIHTGSCRMNLSNSTALGRTAHNVEREICTATEPGKLYDIHVCVCSTAAMADRFRCVFKHQLATIDNRRTRWTAHYVMVFIEKTNFLLRKPIETGAQGAIKSNFNVLAHALHDHAAAANA